MEERKARGPSRSTRALWVFFGVFTLAAILLAVFVSPWASSSPDGLEKVADDKGFIEKADETEPAWKHSPIPDYAVPGIANEKVATGLSGLMGVLITVAVAVGMAMLALALGLLKKKKETNQES